MPKFFYSIIFLLVISWGFVFYILGAVSPDSYMPILFFVLALFFAISLSFSIPVYLLIKKKKPIFLSENLLYRKSLKYAAFIAFGVSGLLFLKGLKILTLLNFGLFMLLYIGVFYQLRGKR